MLRTRRSAPIALLLAALAACHDGSPTSAQVLENTLVFTRADGSKISFNGGTEAWCGPWEKGYDERPAVHVRAFNTLNTGGWMLTAALADIHAGAPQAFPAQQPGQPSSTNFFVYDPPNELSSDELHSTGSITFTSVPCAGSDEVAFTIDATLDSELHDLPPITVKGSFRAQTVDR
ncbi:MAG TPA: hypothetical protein VFH27_12415 [Longimicrobiaceae bacterium]|nr:hypothetical protein [Longimicrobiaceae bacterium]